MLIRVLAKSLIVLVLSGACFASACIFSSGDDVDHTQDTSVEDAELDAEKDTSDSADTLESDVTDTDEDTDRSDTSDVHSDVADTDDTQSDAPDAACADNDACSDCAAQCEQRANAISSCDEEGCSYECKPDYSDINGDLNESTSDGCEGECAPTAVRTYYLDGDNDSFGDPGSPRDACPGTQPTTYVSNSADCDDNDDRVNEDYSGDFQTEASSNNTGTFDYDCDGEEEKEYPNEADCALLQRCESDVGWANGVAECGERAQFITQCGFCETESEMRTQGCK